MIIVGNMIMIKYINIKIVMNFWLIMCCLRENFDISCLFIGGYDIFRWGTRKKYYILKIF